MAKVIDRMHRLPRLEKTPSLSILHHPRPAQDVERLRVADGAHLLLVDGDQVVTRLDAAISRKGAAGRHAPIE